MTNAVKLLFRQDSFIGWTACTNPTQQRPKTHSNGFLQTQTTGPEKKYTENCLRKVYRKERFVLSKEATKKNGHHYHTNGVPAKRLSRMARSKQTISVPMREKLKLNKIQTISGPLAIAAFSGSRKKCMYKKKINPGSRAWRQENGRMGDGERGGSDTVCLEPCKHANFNRTAHIRLPFTAWHYLWPLQPAPPPSPLPPLTNLPSCLFFVCPFVRSFHQPFRPFLHCDCTAFWLPFYCYFSSPWARFRSFAFSAF